MARWETAREDGLAHLIELRETSPGVAGYSWACGLRELGRPGEDNGKGRCRDCAEMAALMRSDECS